MGIRKITKAYYVVAIGLTILVINLCSTNRKEYAQVDPRYLSSEEDDMRSVEQNREMIHSNRELSSNTGSKNLYVVINTPKMGSDGLTSTVKPKGCNESKINVVHELKRFDCPDGHEVLRTHKFDIGSKAIEQYRKDNAEGRCLIVTAIRNPASWFPSYFVQTMGRAKFVRSLGGCNLDEWPSREELLRDFRDFLVKNSSAYDSLTLALPGLLNEFGGGSLREQFEIMDKNNGYSELGPAPPGSIVAGCNLLFLRMEQSDRWPAIFKKIDPTIQFKKGLARIDRCPNLSQHIKVIQDYKMTVAEKNFIYQRGDEYIKDWFDAYGFRKETSLNDEVFA